MINEDDKSVLLLSCRPLLLGAIVFVTNNLAANSRGPPKTKKPATSELPRLLTELSVYLFAAASS
eukprot:scaffold16738_cov47-Attheya_sp.AAC.2